MKIYHEQGNFILDVRIDGHIYKVTPQGIDVSEEVAQKMLEIHGEVIKIKKREKKETKEVN